MYMDIGLCKHLSAGDHGCLEALDYHKAEGTGSCEPPHKGAGNEHRDRCKSNMNSYLPPALKV